MSSQTLATIYAETAGNPFFLHELGRHLQRPGQARLPATVRQAVGLRLGALSAPTREMLQLAAVFTAGSASSSCPR